MRGAARFFRRDDLFEALLIAAGKERGAVEDDVDLVRACFDGAPDFGEAQIERREARRKRARDAGDAHTAARERVGGGADERRVDAHRGDGRDAGLRRVGMDRLGTQRLHLARRVGAFERREVDATDRKVDHRGFRRRLERARRE